jgi:anti-sigma B factor antagonist
MQISIERGVDASGRTVLTVSGAIDVQSRDQLGSAGREALGGGANPLVLDLADVTFIDSTGIGTLIELGHDAEDAEAGLVIRNPSPRVTRILQLTGLEDAWDVESAAI